MAKCCVETMMRMIEEEQYEEHQVLDVKVTEGGTVRR